MNHHILVENCVKINMLIKFCIICKQLENNELSLSVCCYHLIFAIICIHFKENPLQLIF